nr:unnamed protein product [Digitaria exilis]
MHVNSSSVDCEQQKKEENEQALSRHESEFDKIMKAVNNAYEIQAAATRTCSHPVADITFYNRPLRSWDRYLAQQVTAASWASRIKQLVSGKNPSGNPIFGDPKQLDSVKLPDLHPASPLLRFQIPSAPDGSCKASFLTYHSLGKLVPSYK